MTAAKDLTAPVPLAPGESAFDRGSAPAPSDGRARLIPSLIAAAVALAAAAPLAALMSRINGGGVPIERAVALCVLLAGAAAAIPTGVYLVATRGRAVADRAALIALASLLVALVGIAFYYLFAHVVYPADFLIWSESDFVNDILKFRVGYPLYTAQANNDSFCYMPGAQLFTYFIARLVGHPTSVVAYRAIQVGYTIAASFVALACVHKLIEASGRRIADGARRWWSAVWILALVLCASNAITNAYVMELHNDALGQLVSLVAFWLLLDRAITQRKATLVAMAIVPALGFMVKQNLVLWAALYCAYLFFFERSFVRTVLFGAASFGLVAVVFGIGYLLWGQDLVYWTVKVLGSHGVDPLRSIQHALDAWTYFAGSFLGAAVLLRGPRFRMLLGPWLASLFVLAVGAYTSGIAWMLNHMGPGSLMAGVWLVAGATVLWLDHFDARRATAPKGEQWLRAGIAVATAVLVVNGLGAIRVPTKPLSDSAYRYAHDIQNEFTGADPSRVLLDAGTWMYVPSGTIMKDRAPTVGERGWSLIGDYSQTIARIHEKRYDKILVRNYDKGDFWYDHESWRRSSGIRAAMQRDYHVAKVIPAVKLDGKGGLPYLFNAVSVLEPNAD